VIHITLKNTGNAQDTVVIFAGKIQLDIPINHN